MLQLLKDLIALFFYLCLLWVSGKKEVVLVYHSVSNEDKKHDPLKLNVNPGLFQRQMRYLSRLKPKAAVKVTFDDGFENFFYYAYPVLLRYNIYSILFITPEFINKKVPISCSLGQHISWMPLNWQQVREISDSGIEIGAHGLKHLNLPGLSGQDLVREIAGSKMAIEAAVGRRVRYFAYPYGSRTSFNAEIKRLIRDSGYDEAYTNIMGFNRQTSDRYELSRIRIYSNDNMFRFRLKLRGAYNWVDWLVNLNAGMPGD